MTEHNGFYYEKSSFDTPKNKKGSTFEGKLELFRAECMYYLL